MYRNGQEWSTIKGSRRDARERKGGKGGKKKR